MALADRLTVGLRYRSVVAITAQYDGRGDRRKGRVGGISRQRNGGAGSGNCAIHVIATGGGIILTEFNRHIHAK